VKKGCTPQQLIYNYANDKVYAVNDEKEDKELRAAMKVYDLSGKVLVDASCDVQMPMGCSKEVFEVMSVAGGESPVKFVFLTLSDASGNVSHAMNMCFQKSRISMIGRSTVGENTDGKLCRFLSLEYACMRQGRCLCH
jgi:hypothetical protein